MQRLATWLSSMVWWSPIQPPPDDPEAFARREADLQRRLERLTYEVDVIHRTGVESESGEAPPE